MMVPQSWFEQRVLTAQSGRRLVACIGASVLLHAALVIWIRLQSIEFDIANSSRLFIFDARFKREPAAIETPVAPQRRGNPNAAKIPPLHPSASAKPVTPATGPEPIRDAVQAAPGASEHATIDLAKAKGLALEYDRQNHKTADPRFDANADMTPALETETAAARAIAKAAKPDCRQAYGGEWGLLAIAFFIRDAATNPGCTW
jgi:hypothetical protein